MSTGELLSLYRQEAGMTIDELVEKSGVPKGTINKIISGDTRGPSLPTMKAIAKALGKTLNDFAEDEDEDTQKKENPPAPAKPEQGDEKVSKPEWEVFLQAFGIAEIGEDLTQADADFLSGLLNLIRSWLQEKRQQH